MHRQLLLRGLPPLACDDDESASASSSSSTSCVLLDEHEWRSSSPRDAVAAALIKRHHGRRRCRCLSSSVGLSHAAALAFADKCWLELNGRPLPRDVPLGTSCSASSFSSSSGSLLEEINSNPSPPPPHLTVECRLSTLGGGGDGGSTGAESRSSYLEMYASVKPDAVDPRLLELTRATTCALSGERLRPPLCADALGSLFNKDAVVSLLLEQSKSNKKASLPASMAHVSSLKHVFDARMTEIGQEGNGGVGAEGNGANASTTTTAAEKSSNGTGGTSTSSSSSLSPRFCCPITGIQLNGRNKFLLLRPSGLVVSERAVRVAMPAVEEAAAELVAAAVAKGSKKAEEEHKAKTTTTIDLSAAIRLLPPLSELAAAREKLLLERAAEAAAKAQKKKHKKDKKRKDGERRDDDGDGDGDGGNGDGDEEAAAKKKRLEEEEEAERKRRLVAASTAALAPKGADKEVFASIFLSSKKDTGENKETFACRSTALGRR